MHYYEVWVGSQKFHGEKPLTYGSKTSLKPGLIVNVNLRQTSVLGVVFREVKKPKFKTEPIIRLVNEVPLSGENMKLMEWLRSYYPGPSGLITQLFLPNGLLQKARQIDRKTNQQKARALPELTNDQKLAIKQINKTPLNKPVMLHGDTGTGKTRVYLELAIHEFNNERSVLILTPEIGLTPQLIKTFESVFPGKVVIIHSHLSNAQKRDNWLHILEASEPLVVVGPRSSLFAPIKNLGLIVMDEAHDNAYKQDQVPHYQSSRVAAQLSHLHHARLILGSATPSTSDYYTFKAKSLPIIRMTEPAVKSVSNQTMAKIVSLRNRDEFTKSRWLSNSLLASVEESIRQDQQALLFLNRRGTARIILCQVCGWQLLCPNCDLPLTYHSDQHVALCHTCGHRGNVPTTCANCKSSDIIFKSIGTKMITTELERLFPRARVKRFDSDNLRAESLAHYYEDIRDGNVDILVGTQILSKGLDLPKLGLVGIIVADTGLYIPDYTADEVTFQMIGQVMGRVGRGHQAGKVVLQSYNPDSPVVKAAVNKDYELFYNQQIKERQAFTFPPFCHLLKLTCVRSSQSSAAQACEKLATSLASQNLPINILGPAPAFHEKQNNRYAWQLIIKTKQRSVLTKIIKELPANWFHDIDPINLL
ncbi:MAG TPA: primosomal protein N' [Patescibacteria group bacterium]|nr:primosomal protein N' [Patescibacteria group bacterium]